MGPEIHAWRVIDMLCCGNNIDKKLQVDAGTINRIYQGKDLFILSEFDMNGLGP